MIPDPSTRDQKVTKPDFRPCSACRPHSQAPLCLCTLRLISIQPEGTFGRLRYSLGTLFVWRAATCTASQELRTGRRAPRSSRTIDPTHTTAVHQIVGVARPVARKDPT